MKKSKALYIGVLVLLVAVATVDHLNAFASSNNPIGKEFFANMNGPNFNLVALKE